MARGIGLLGTGGVAVALTASVLVHAQDRGAMVREQLEGTRRQSWEHGLDEKRTRRPLEGEVFCPACGGVRPAIPPKVGTPPLQGSGAKMGNWPQDGYDQGKGPCSMRKPHWSVLAEKCMTAEEIASERVKTEVKR